MQVFSLRVNISQRDILYILTDSLADNHDGGHAVCFGEFGLPQYFLKSSKGKRMKIQIFFLEKSREDQQHYRVAVLFKAFSSGKLIFKGFQGF